MRMRKLGKGQSVMFCISEEMRSRINSAISRDHVHEIEVEDVLVWSIVETHRDLSRNMPIWAMQGLRFDKQRETWDITKTATEIVMSEDQAQRFLEDEAQTLEARYRPSRSDDKHTQEPSPEATAIASAIHDRCKLFGVADLRSVSLVEEQERELSPETEQERQIERPPAVPPTPHSLHPHLVKFTTEGSIPAGSDIFIPCFFTLKETSISNLVDLTQLPDDVLATADYAKTVKSAGVTDLYQRPVQWILTSKLQSGRVKHIVIISPHEAQELMPRIHASQQVHLHLYSPRANLAFNSMDNLTLYTVPPVADSWTVPDTLRLQLNLFAGQLYFSSFSDYRGTCDLLSLAWEPPAEGVEVRADVFMPIGSDGSMRFSTSPVPFIRAC